MITKKLTGIINFSLIFFTLFPTLMISQPQKPEKHKITPEILMSFKRISETKVSPDGKWILYNLAVPNIEENKISRDFYIVSIDGTQTKQITTDPSNEYNGFWMPNGSQIGYITSLSGESQVFITDIERGNSSMLTNYDYSIDNVLISPKSTLIAFTKDVKILQTLKDKYPKYSKAKTRIYDKLPVREWDAWEDEFFSHLCIREYDGGKVIDLMEGEPFDCPLKPFGGIEEIAWSPDGNEIAYTAKKVFDNFVLSTNSDIYIYNIKNRTTKNITEGMPGYDKDPLYSPDGKWIAFHSQERAGFESDRVRLMLYNRETGAITEPSVSQDSSRILDQWVGNMVWAPDSKSIYFTAEDGPIVKIYNMTIPDGKWKTLTGNNYNCDGAIDITPDGKTLVFELRSMTHPTEIFSMPSEGGEMKQITHVNDSLVATLKPINIEQKWIPSIDGKKIHTWVLYPPDFDPKKKYPLMTYCQGGPQSTISHYFSYRWNLYLLASAGYVVVAPNRRGVPGFGQAWNDAISKDWGGMPMQDILAATDYIAKERYIDKDAMCAVGASAGGYATFWLEGNHEKRFKAFVAHCGVFNLESKFGSTEELFFPSWEFGGPYWDPKNKKQYEKNSPHKFADKWDTPILIITGERDFRVPYTQSLEAFTVAQLHGLPSKFLIFPEMNHWVTKPQEVIVWLNEIIDFLDTYCKKKEKN